MLKYDKMKPIRDPKYLAFIRTLPCVATFSLFNVSMLAYLYYVKAVRHKFDSVPHHFGKKGMGQKCSDYLTVPLTQELHNEVHTIGNKRFQEKYNINFVEIADALYELYMEIRKAGK